MLLALAPRSPARALIGYLRAAGVSFMVFRKRKPVAGAATGAHLHIGRSVSPPRPHDN